MNSVFTVLSRLRVDLKYVSLLALIAALLVFYPTTNYAFKPLFLWFIFFNPYDELFYLVYVNYNILFPVGFLAKALIFIVVVSATAFISILISQKLTKATLKTGVKTNHTEIIQLWKTNKKITLIALILQYLTLIALVALAFLIWYRILQQYILIFLSLAMYALIIVSALGIMYLVHPLLDDEVILAQTCLNIINSIEGGSEKEDAKKIELVRFMLYILLNHALSKGIEEIEELKLEHSLTTLFLALLQREKMTLNKAKTIITNLLKAVIENKIQDILKNLSKIDEKLGDAQKLAKNMEISIGYPSLTLYMFNPSKKITRLKAIPPLITEILLAILIFLEKWLYYTTFKIL
nr:hypothetical protein [Candidatus Freyarchaeota archaeon]